MTLVIAWQFNLNDMIQIEGLQYIESIQKKLKRTYMTIDIVKGCNEYYLMISAIMIINSQQIKHYGDNKVDLVQVKLFILPEGTLMPFDLLCNKILIHYITVTPYIT